MRSKRIAARALAALFDVTAEESFEYKSGEVYDVYNDSQSVIYAFAITNNSEVDITYDMLFNITIDLGGYDDELSNLKFILIDENDGNNIEFDNNTSFSYNTEDYGTTFSLTAENSNTFVLVADYS